jgi:hypothetical protein
LFTSEDLKTDSQVAKINRAGTISNFAPPKSYFPTPPGYYKQKFKPFMGPYSSRTSYGRGTPSYKPFKGKGKPSFKGGKAFFPTPSTNGHSANFNSAHSGNTFKGIHSDPSILPKTGTHCGIGKSKRGGGSESKTGGLNLAKGKLVGGHSFAPKASKKYGVVGKTCFKGSNQSTQGRYKTSLALTPQDVPKSATKGGTRFDSNSKNTPRLPKFRSHKTCGRPRFRSSNSMVSDFKTGGGGDQVETNLRLPRTQQVVQPPPLSSWIIFNKSTPTYKKDFGEQK